MLKVPLKNPKPDFEELRKIILGKKEAKRVHFVEFLADAEIINSIMRDFLGEENISFSPETKKSFLKRYINWWYIMGYDYITLVGPGFVFGSNVFFDTSRNETSGRVRITEDTALLSRGERAWIEEGTGIIGSWEDFEKYPWANLNKVDSFTYEFVTKNLPEGMKIMVCTPGGVFELCSQVLLGFEGLSYLLYDKPDLVEAVFNKAGETIYAFFKNVVGLDKVGGFFQCDDLGFTTSTIVSPEILRRLVLPWHKRFASLAHQYNKMYWLHCCGNVSAIMGDLIDDVGIDAFHSFQDVIMPVTEFKKRYGDKIAALGGVDMDKLCRLDEENLRKYVRHMLDECMPYRYALGSGNSIANYVPLKNYLIMLDEGARWKS